jgi:nucleoside-diphosphate-sugar epimerase
MHGPAFMSSTKVSSTKPIVLLTGSSGLIGRAVAGRLSQDYAVIGLDHEPPQQLEALEEFVPLDLTNDDSTESGLKHIAERWGRNVASVIHLAAYYDFSGEPSPLYQKVTVQGTQRLLAGLQRLAVEQLVFSSTTLLHAPTEPGQPINEDAPIDAKWDYPTSKVETERIVRRDCGSPSLILRIAGVYDDDCHSLPIANQIQRIYERRLIARVFPGDTSHGQPFVHLADLLEAFALAVAKRRDLPRSETLLIGETDVMSYDELQRAISLILHGEEWETQRIPKPIAKAGAWVQDQVPGEEPFIKPWMIDLADDHLELDISRARAKLGWEPRRSLRESLPRILERLQSDPVKWYRTNKLSLPAWLEPSAPPVSKPAAE